MLVMPVEETQSSDRPIIVRIAATVAAAALLLGALAALVVAWWAGLIVAVAVAAAAWFGAIAPRLASAEARVGRLVGPTRELGGTVGELRFANLVEGLAPSAGIPRPRCLLIDDAAPNALVFGRTPRRGHVVLTSGLLAQLDRMELEAVVAHCAVRIHAGAAAYATTALAFGVRPRAAGPATADLSAAALTRYPPGLIGALRAIAAAGPAVPVQASAALHDLWIAPPGVDVTDRLETLEER